MTNHKVAIITGTALRRSPKAHNRLILMPALPRIITRTKQTKPANRPDGSAQIWLIGASGPARS